DRRALNDAAGIRAILEHALLKIDHHDDGLALSFGHGPILHL
ncbi:MAG: hypothetical protein QOK06_3266, partial [Acidimicrobiaceae bacterium]